MKLYDVFISFIGIDTRRTFVSHLLVSLFKKQITTFKTEEEKPWRHRQSLWAIGRSKIAIVVISKNYASSVSCLDELAKVFECKEKRRLGIVPVFYEVDPSDVIRQVEDHGDGDNNLEKVKRWRDALEKLIEIYHQDYSYWEKEDSYSYILDRVMIHVSRFLSELKNLSIVEDDLDYPLMWECSASSLGWALCGSAAAAAPAGVGYSSATAGVVYPSTWACSASPGTDSQWSDWSPTVTKRIGLVRAALRVTKAFMYGGESSGIKPRPPGCFLDMQKDNYVVGNNLSRLVLSNDFNNFVGMDRLMKEVNTLLDLKSRNETLEIGISGGRGVGKTTLARYVYEQISPQFQDHHYFIQDTKNCSLGTCLLEKIARAPLMIKSESLDDVVKAKLGHRKVLLIVDDVYHIQQLNGIRKISRWFGPGSRLIYVTQHMIFLDKCGVQRRYVVEPLRLDEALQLFSQFAFKQEQVPREYHWLSLRAVSVTGRIPLALKVFGSFLCGKLISEWELELCRLEAPQSRYDYVAKVSRYIGDALS